MVTARGCSRLLQKAVTDFGADLPYAQAMDKLLEHYGVVLPESTIGRITLHHAQRMHEQNAGQPQGLPNKVPDKQVFIAEVDGTMVPTVHPADDSADRRKGKSTQWEEVKLSLAHAHGSKQVFYAATLQGQADTAGKQLRACVKRAGFGAGHRVHGLGDGAPWIAQQVKKRFAGQGNYLLDFYHVCEYLGQAAQAIEEQPAAQRHWLEQQKQRFKTAQLEAVLRTLQSPCESEQTPEQDAPVLALPCQPPGATGLRRGNRPRLTHRIGRDRECASLRDSKALEAARRLVESKQRPAHARVATEPRQLGVGFLLVCGHPLRRLRIHPKNGS
jgi:hypothetical protein